MGKEPCYDNGIVQSMICLISIAGQISMKCVSKESLPGDIRHAFSHNQREPSVGIHCNDLSDIPTSSFGMILSDPVHQLPASWSHHNGCICSLRILPSSAHKAVPDTGLHSFGVSERPSQSQCISFRVTFCNSSGVSGQ